MRLVVQRVRRAAVRCDGEVLGAIEAGAVVLVGVGRSDDEVVVDRMADKLLKVRYFQDAAGRTNLDLAAAGGALLVVSQFTLYADLRGGRRPGFTDAAHPEQAEPMVARLVGRLRAAGARVATGRFGASMEIELVNDGPFTLLLDSDVDLGAVTGPA